jgi:YfiR/HmsC-like
MNSNHVPRGRRRRYARRSFFCVLLLMAVAWLAGTSVCVADEPLPSEYQVKAAFLINFPKYADWPAAVFAELNSPIVIAVLGETKVFEELKKLIAGRTINGREIVLKRAVAGTAPGVCHILFFSAAEQRHSANLLAKLKNISILTVGESDDFLERGGVINLARRNRKIALEVNLAAASNSRIKISSKLLSVANVVEGKSE